MERKRITQNSPLLWVLVAVFLSQNLLVPVMCIRFEDEKHYYSPDPHAGTPPSGSHGTPSTPSPSHGTPSTPSPSHGTPSTPSPSHGTPSHGGYTPTPSRPSPSPPSNCGTPSHTPTPSRPSTPPSGGYYRSPPPSGSGTPPTPIYVSPPTTPIIDPGTPSTPSTPPSGGYYRSPPPTPIYVSPPSTPIIDPGTPSTPGTSVPTPPYFPAPLPPFTGTCDYWRNHPTLIWGVLGWWGTVGSAFGVSSLPGLGANVNLLQALSNTRTDGLGDLYREGTASWLNSMVNNRFPFTTKQVRENFMAALETNKAAAGQARIFRLANEGRLKPRS